MYFDPRPKRRREDLFGRERELREFESSVKTNPLTVVSGIRRVGKTSLILIALEDKPGLVIDLRGVGQSRRDLYLRVEDAVSEFARRRGPLWRRIAEKLRVLSGVSVAGSGISVSWGR
jgi:AAA+ ATPase superfamily predicted ATPase